MATKTIYIFRHGQTDLNLQHRPGGQLDIPLNETGLQQASELADKMARLSIEAIYSSPLTRAMQTAQKVADKTGAIIIQAPGLMERNLGKLQGHRVIQTDDPEKLKNDYTQTEVYAPTGWVDDVNWRPEDGETHNESVERAERTFMEIIQNTPYNTIGISTHSGPMRTIIKRVTGDSPWVNNCDYVTLVFDGKNWMKS